MTTPRRRILRFTNVPPQPDARQQERLRKLRERPALARWTTRLRRAFHQVEKWLLTIARAEREITKTEGP